MKRILVLGLFLFPALGVVLRGSPELLGPTQREDILKHNPEWEALVASYNPKPEVIEQLRNLRLEVQVEVFMGTWCTDSRDHVTEYFKILDLTDNPMIRSSYFGIPEDKAKRAAYFKGRAVEKLPTFIVYVDGKEKGRIVEAPAKSIEEDLLALIEK